MPTLPIAPRLDVLEDRAPRRDTPHPLHQRLVPHEVLGREPREAHRPRVPLAEIARVGDRAREESPAEASGARARSRDGEGRLAWALVVVLACSRHQYVHVTYPQRVAEVIGGLEDAWLFFGGVVQRLVVDNFPAAVTKADRYDPIFQRTFEEYARYRGFLIDAAAVRMPTGKPHVERGVQYVRENFFRGETWRDLPHVHAAALWATERQFRRVKGHRHLPLLKQALHARLSLTHSAAA